MIQPPSGIWECIFTICNAVFMGHLYDNQKGRKEENVLCKMGIVTIILPH